jgi:hypothetical protein
MDPERRLLFWLKVPFVADAALVVIGVLLVFGSNVMGWWVLVFAAVRFIVGALSVWVIAPRVLARRQSTSPST